MVSKGKKKIAQYVINKLAFEVNYIPEGLYSPSFMLTLL